MVQQTPSEVMLCTPKPSTRSLVAQKQANCSSEEGRGSDDGGLYQLLRCEALLGERCAVTTVTDLGLMARFENGVVLL